MTNIPKDQRAWVIGASEVGAIFGAHPQISAFELHHQKRRTLPSPDLDGVERVFWGQVLEPSIAKGVAIREDIKTRKVRRYIVHPRVKQFGASLDYEIISHPFGPGHLEIKNVDYLIWRNWPDPDNDVPLYMQLQLQAQLACTGRRWGIIAVLVGGNDIKIYKYERHENAIRKIEAAVDLFWKHVRQEIEPAPDFVADAAAISAVYAANDDHSIDMSGEGKFYQLCRQYYEAQGKVREAGVDKVDAKSQLLIKMKGADTAFCNEFTIKRGGQFRLIKRKEEGVAAGLDLPLPVAEIEKDKTPVEKLPSFF